MRVRHTHRRYPNKPITIIVPFAAGGPTDIVARVIAAQFSSSLGQQAVVENVVGAAGTIGMVRAARAAPDGYTLLLAGMSTMSFSPTVYPNIQAHSINSFEPVGIVASAPIVLTVGKQVPASNVKEFADHLRAMGDKANNGHAGVGSSSHLACALVNSAARRQAVGRSLQGHLAGHHDMLAGQIHYFCDQTTSVMTQVQAGGVKALAVLADQRSTGAAGCADDLRSGLSGRRDGAVERGVRAQGHAAGDRQAAQCRDRQGHRGAGRDQAVLGSGRRTAGPRAAVA